MAADPLSEDVTDELEMLEGTYGEAYAFDEARGEAQVALGGRSALVSITVGVGVGAQGYPEEAPPSVRVVRSLGLSDGQATELEERLRDMAEEYVGMPSTAMLFSEAQEAMEGVEAAGFECLICLGRSEDPAAGFAPPCGHAFHRSCFSRWMAEHAVRASETAGSRRDRAAMDTEQRAAEGALRQVRSVMLRADSAAAASAARLAATEAWYAHIKALAEGATGAASEREGVSAALAVPAELAPDGSNAASLTEGVVTADDAAAAAPRLAAAVKAARRAVRVAESAAADAARSAARQEDDTSSRLGAVATAAEEEVPTPCPACGAAVTAEEAAELEGAGEAEEEAGPAEGDAAMGAEAARAHAHRTAAFRRQLEGVRRRLGWAEAAAAEAAAAAAAAAAEADSVAEAARAGEAASAGFRDGGSGRGGSRRRRGAP